MKPIPLHRIAAPSPSVLSFLRTQVKNAFDSPSAQCAALRTQRRGYVGMCRGRGGLDGRTREGNTTGLRGFGLRNSLGLPQSCCLNSRSTRLTVGKCQTSLIPPTHSPSIFSSSLLHSREFSTSSLSKAWQLFGGKRGQQARLQPPPLPLRDVMMGEAGTNGFEGLGRLGRSANDLKMRCTELDEQGNVTMVSGEFKKSELIAKVGSAG